MNIEFGTSIRGRPTLICQGYEYVKKQETKTTHWICRHYRQIKCSSFVITSGSEFIKAPKDHICNLKQGATKARQAKNKMKEKALTTTNYVAIASTLQELQNDLATQMNFPPQETIVKSLNRYMRKFANALLHILHGKDFQTPEEFEDFVTFDKGKNEPERFIMFALTEMLLLLEPTKDLWLDGGTFKQCPDKFYQLYTIHITVGGYNPPCIYLLLPNKTEKTYHDFTQALLQLIPNANPEWIKMDFEKAAVNAFSTTFPTAQITGCYFHLCQSVLRKINEVGLKKAYTTNPELALALKMVPATAFFNSGAGWRRFQFSNGRGRRHPAEINLTMEFQKKSSILLAFSKKPTLEVLAKPHYLNPQSGIKPMQLLKS